MSQAPQSGGLSDRLVDGLLELISEGALGPGDSLPTVRELAQRFAVTTPTIREALRRLQTTDAVRMRHGSGIYVGDGIHRMLMPNPNSTPLKDEHIVQLVEARLTIEPGIAALAAANRTVDDLERLARAVDTAKRAAEDNRPKLNFHRELAAASGNQVLFEVVDSLLAARSREQRALRAQIENRARDYEQHVAIFLAVESGDVEQARHLTEQHLHDLRTTVTDHLGTHE
ncbi:FadR/GntR family transcriptional regulator [Kutzneria kofuensis]|uniref:DNA-binding FadR family transcriptional regulator n=1 Tax=Kutzneria kofuensis TaxID=103725 RepID=A0A7W9KNQ2_9PSEU|nr:FadR/GntR family transcriptional regulator [Kutzneria kofuensis]MBB5895916.1 DNA-binding FadR family transcriptional regulator [Kutzneria kofuensis]